MQKKEEQYAIGGNTKKNTNQFVLQLYITGATPNSIRALINIKKLCEEHLKGQYSLEIIDVYQQRELAEKEQLIALPLLIKKQPLPEKRIIGDLSNTSKVLAGLGLIQ